MTELKDSGNRREFASGAVRDISVGKGRCDLLVLDVVSRLMGDDTLGHINAYMEDGNTNHIDDAINSFIFEDDVPFTEHREMVYAQYMLAVAKHYERGAVKYGDNNYRKGIPIHCYIDSGVRHYLKHLAGEDDEPHDVAFLWNMLCLIWTHHHRPECIDIKFREEE